jgi:hypothetical protein
MSIQNTIPRSSKLYIAGGVFKATLNNPTIGKYDFTNLKVGGNRVNVSVPLGLAMNPNYLYFFHQMNFSLSIAESDFLQAIEAGSVPELAIKDNTNFRNIFHAPFRLFRYFENAAVDSFHLNLNANAVLIADFQSNLNLIASLVGITDIYAQVAFSIYEITENKYIKDYKREVQD